MTFDEREFLTVAKKNLVRPHVRNSPRKHLTAGTKKENNQR